MTRRRLFGLLLDLERTRGDREREGGRRFDGNGYSSSSGGHFAGGSAGSLRRGGSLRERTAPDIYEVPVAEVEHLERETESYLVWVVVLGFVAYAIALYWAHKCERRGGDASIKYSILKGFKVRCVK